MKKGRVGREKGLPLRKKISSERRGKRAERRGKRREKREERRNKSAERSEKREERRGKRADKIHAKAAAREEEYTAINHANEYEARTFRRWQRGGVVEKMVSPCDPLLETS